MVAAQGAHLKGKLPGWVKVAPEKSESVSSEGSVQKDYYKVKGKVTKAPQLCPAPLTPDNGITHLYQCDESCDSIDMSDIE